MKILAEIQNKFIDGIYDQSKSEISRLIKNSKVPKEELLDIYRNNLYATLTNALKITYPKIYQFTGKRKFKEFCVKFIKQNRSYSGNLDDYGGNLADFFEKEGDKFLSDLAKLEWLKHKAYLAKDKQALDIEKLQKLPQEKLFDIKFQLHPTCFLFTSNYNLLRKIRQTKPIKKQIYFLIYRCDFEVRVEKISKNEFKFLCAIRENLSLYQIYEKYKINIQSYLQKYLINGVLNKFYL